MRTPPLALPLLALVACRATPSTMRAAPRAVATAGGDRAAVTAPAPALTVRARAAHPMPACESSDLIGLAALSEGLAAHGALARNERGGLAVYRVDANHDGAAELVAQPLDAGGHPRGAALTVATGAFPAHAALATQGGGFLLAWRDGAPGHERIAAQSFDAEGALRGPVDAVSAIESGWLGAPALAVAADGNAYVAVARSEAPPGDRAARAGDALLVAPVERGMAAVQHFSPAGSVFDGERAPLLVPRTRGVRAFAEVRDAADAAPGAARALIEANGSVARVVARGVSGAGAYPLRDGALLGWRAPVGALDVAARVYALPDALPGRLPAPLSPPVTAAVFRGAFDARVAFAPVADGLLGAFTTSTLGDDAGGSLNLSVFTDDGAYVGRRPLLVTALLRNARVTIAAPSTGTAGELWALLEARSDGGGGPVLGLATARCDSRRAADPLELPPPALVQQLTEPEAPAATLERAPPLPVACAAASAPARLAGHHRVEETTPQSSAAVVALAGGASLAFTSAVASEELGRLMLAVQTVDARGVVGAARLLDDGGLRVFAAGAVAGGAFVLAGPADPTSDRAARIITVGPDGRARGDAALGITAVRSAVALGDGAVLVAGARAGESALWLVPWRGPRRAGEPVRVAPLRPGDRVLDAARIAGATVALLARPDALGGAAQQLARALVPDRAAHNAPVLDPFADPLGYSRGRAVLAPGGAVLYADGDVLRASTLRGALLREPRSVLRVFPHGGALAGAAPFAGGTRLLAVNTGLPDDAAVRVAPISLVAVGADGALAGLGRAAPDDPGASADDVAIAVDGSHATVVYPRLERQGVVEWMVVTARCSASAATAGGAR